MSYSTECGTFFFLNFVDAEGNFAKMEIWKYGNFEAQNKMA